ncbi:3-phytase A precursor [Amylocarpus encephaloides]|uniref:3-phytase n=1 Tax=Amylocarpus encephaloides TaxID=45428 RepID=A0A9P7YMW1_9HELO|nr:3-phytase A precursor [Amylocarpus encephaloides]
MGQPREEAESLIRKSYEMEDLSRDHLPVMKEPKRTSSKRVRFLTLAALIAVGLVAVYCSLKTIREVLTESRDGKSCKPAHSKVPQYFDPDPELWPGPTATGRAPFLAQETVVPSLGPAPNKTIERLWGHLSPYSPNHEGWGIEEYPLPVGAEVTQVHVLHRHGSRYPTIGVNVQSFGAKMASLGGKFTTSGPLSFLTNWTYGLGAEIMVPMGRMQLFKSGVDHYYQYGHLYEPGSKILVRSTTQKRMRESVWNFLSGFFGLDWEDNAEVGYGIEGFSKTDGWNNSLAGYDNCPNSNSFQNKGGSNASVEWVGIYLQNATARINTLIDGVDFDVLDVYAMQTMCPYEYAAYGYSPFCHLFTYPEWEGFEYSIDLLFSGGSAFQSPTGRAVGLAWHQEFLARLEHRILDFAHSQINTTLDGSPRTFPVDQKLYFDFSHDTNIMSIITSLGFTQFGQVLHGNEYPGEHNLTVSHTTPFGARLDVEILKTPHPVLGDREYDAAGAQAEYVRFKLNERTLPHPRCPERRDGLCELGALIKILEDEEKKAKYDFACFGDYEAVAHGDIKDGSPLK